MKCPGCHNDNNETQKFCRICGIRLQITCPTCGTSCLLTDRFCTECGLALKEQARTVEEGKESVGERKYVTALFADLSGYTTLAERLDPEEVKDLIGHLLREIAKVVLRYEGFVEKFVGDAIMALFGVPKSHEDDPIRAVCAAREIHHLVGTISPKVEKRIGQPLALHVGINTGLVVTGGPDLEEGTEGVAGDAVNVASRLCSLAKAGETLVGQTTYTVAAGSFAFERLEPLNVKGRTKPVLVYKLLARKELPSTTHRISGLKADLIGRNGEMEKLKEAVRKLLDGKRLLICICGEAGSGKSRLVEEFKSGLDLTSIYWREGHAHAYTQNIPYYPLIDLLNRDFRIEETDLPEMARAKAERGIKAIVGDREDVLPYLAGLLSSHYPEVENVSPDVWKSRLHRAAAAFLSALMDGAPTIINMEDLHWADPSSLELLRLLVWESHHPALFLCTYRPPLSLFPENQLKEMGQMYQEVKLLDLSRSETLRMVGSLLGTEAVPLGLQRIIHEKVGGNPFYVEEVINSFIESGLLIRDNGHWSFSGPMHEISVPPTIQGVIEARLDRLDAATKAVLKEAAVVGRTFYLEVLASITAVAEPIDQSLHKLEELDLIRVRSTHPDVEYTFKHALIQEAAYSGLLRRERKNIHERTGLALEKFFGERSIESWETLAFHFRNGRSVRKAVDYLVRSGDRSLKRYALEESHEYYRQAFDLLSQERDRSQQEDFLLIDLLMEWCLVFYYQGRFQSLTELLLSHVSFVESLHDKAKSGSFYAWLGFSAFWQGARLEDSYRYLRKALELGEQAGDQRVITYACAFLIKTCAEMGYLEEGAVFETRTQQTLGLFPADAFLHMNYYSGKGYLGWFSGDKQKLYESAQGLLDYGEEKSNLRCQMGGYMLMGVRHFVDLDIDAAVKCVEKVMAQGDPYHAQFARVLLAMFLVHVREFQAAAGHLTQVIEYSNQHGTDYLKTFANLFQGVVSAGQGNLEEGIRLVKSSRQEFLDFQRNVLYGLSEYVLGAIYLQILQRSGSKRLLFLLKNVGFLIKNALAAGKKAEKHLRRAVEVARQAGAKGFLGRPCLHLGLLFESRGQREKAREYVAEAVRVFEECQLEIYWKQAKEVLDSLG